MIQKSTLPVIQAIIGAVKKDKLPDMTKTLFVCVQHFLHTSVHLFEALIHLGANPQHIFLMGKHYSTCPDVVKKLIALGIQVQPLTPLKNLGEYTGIFKKDIQNMWDSVEKYSKTQSIDAIIVLDDGGRCLEFIPASIRNFFPVVGIEQTTAGLFNPAVVNSGLPLIDVATCAAKTYLESDMIIDSILDKLKGNLPPKIETSPCGIIGVGTIGKSIARKLVSLGYQVLIHDQQEHPSKKIEGTRWINTMDELFMQADYIFGCTGRDITATLHPDALFHRDKVFISCTSEDKEFLSLLKRIQPLIESNILLNPLDDIHWTLPNKCSIRVLKGGFPINFDFSGEAVPANNIQLTRGLLLCALLQALILLPKFSRDTTRIMLSPAIQRFVVLAWIATDPVHAFSPELLREFENNLWISKNSSGYLYEDHYIPHYFDLHRNA